MQTGEDLKIGYYTQDFHNLDYGKSVRLSLLEAMGLDDLVNIDSKNEQYMRKIAAGFLITADQINSNIGDLSEGQKGLVAFAHIVLQKPGLLILDEPTNHINFRHIPIIAKALGEYEGAMILVSHVPDFVSQIRIDKKIDLQKI
jgi:ATP-binding cassette subfamily F protein 3